MGQCYSVNLTTKYVIAPLLVELTNKYLKDNQREDHDYKDWKKAVDAIIGDTCRKIPPQFTESPEGITISSGFDASYGYHGFMTDWFETVASAFAEGTEFWVYPDEGASRQVIQNGEVTCEDLDVDDLVDYNPYLKKIFNRIMAEVPDVEDQEYEIKHFLGDYGDEDCCVDEALGEDTEAELTEEQCEQIKNIIKEEQKNQKEN